MSGDERGSVTAEFAVVLPAVVLVLVLAVSALGATGRQVRLEQAAAQAARLAARGEPDARVRAVAAAVAGPVSVDVRADGDLVCVSLTADSAPPLPTLRARSCALADGW